jgi:dTDP-4-dehydrorhamnose reductase
MRRHHRGRGLLVVTGATGFLGTHLVEAASSAGWQLIALPSGTLDVRDRARVIDQVASWKPRAVVHLAYRRDRDVIVLGSRNVAEAAAAIGASLVHLSTDLVFAGRAMAYAEADSPDAGAGYGRWKAEAEAEVLHAHPDAVLVRTSLMYGTHHLATIQHDVAEVLAGRSTMAFFTDEYRCPAHAADVAAAVVALADRSDLPGPLHVAGPQAVSRADLAAAFASQMGGDPSQLRTCTVAESGQDRAADVLLDSTRAASLGIECRPLAEALHRT